MKFKIKNKGELRNFFRYQPCNHWSKYYNHDTRDYWLSISHTGGWVIQEKPTYQMAFKLSFVENFLDPNYSTTRESITAFFKFMEKVGTYER